MPTAQNRNLTLTTVNNETTTINVTYDAVFSQFERRLAALGMVFEERIAVMGIDPPGSTSGTVLTSFPRANLPVTDGAGSLTIPRNLSRTVPRATLQEDTGANDDDEIRCRIRIAAVGLPPEVTTDRFTNEQLIGG